MNRPLTLTVDGSTRSFFYDPMGRWSGAVRGTSIDTIKTDLAGRPSTAISVRNGRVYTQHLAYSPESQRLSHQFVYGGNNKTTRWGYDQQGRLDSLTDASGLGATTLGYDAEGGNIARWAPGLTYQTGYSGRHAPSGVYYSVPTLNRSYAYEAGTGFISNRILADSGKEYIYDNLGQLTQVKRYSVTDPTNECAQVAEANGELNPQCANKRFGIVTQQTFAYDTLGNRTDLPHLMQNNRQSTFNGQTFYYDADGNLTSHYRTDGSVTTLAWSADGELTRWVRRQWNAPAMLIDSVTFGYDGFGRRTRKTSVNTGVHECLHDGDHLLAELDAAGDIRSQYTYYPGVDKPHSVTMTSSGQTYWFATEAPGSVTGLTAGTSALAASWKYDVWGVPTTVTGNDNLPMQLRFAAREYDAETWLYYNRARYYNPETGRFISEDKIGLEGGSNLYVYAENNPINATDPSGLKRVCISTWSGETTSESEGIRWTSSPGRWSISCWDDGNDGGSSRWERVAWARDTWDADEGGPRGGAYDRVLMGTVPFVGGPGRAFAGRLTGFTKHGINSAINHDGVGVSSRAILDAVSNPLRMKSQVDGATKFVGKYATVVLNSAGRVITTYARTMAGWRIHP